MKKFSQKKIKSAGEYKRCKGFVFIQVILLLTAISWWEFFILDAVILQRKMLTNWRNSWQRKHEGWLLQVVLKNKIRSGEQGFLEQKWQIYDKNPALSYLILRKNCQEKEIEDDSKYCQDKKLCEYFIIKVALSSAIDCTLNETSFLIRGVNV